MIEILVGPIASGKSTYSKKRAEQGAIVISRDSITQSLTGGLRSWQNDDKFLTLYEIVQRTAIVRAADLGFDVVVDGTPNTKDDRAKFIDMARTYGFDIHAVVFPRDHPLVHAKRRFEHDAREYDLDRWIAVAEYHNSVYEEVSDEEGFDRITRL